MTYRELNGCTGTWRDMPAVIAAEGEGCSMYFLQNHADGAHCGSKLKAMYPQFKYSYSLCKTFHPENQVDPRELSGFVLDPIQGVLTWKTVKKFNL